MITWIIYLGILLYWEIVYHIGCFGLTVSQPWVMLGLLAAVASLETLITGCMDGRHRRKVFWVLTGAQYLIFAVQTVYFTIFRQPLQVQAMIRGGQDALTSYWREALLGVLKASPILIILALPLAAAGILFYRKGLKLRGLSGIQKIRTCFVLGVAFLGYWMSLELGKAADADYYYEYTEFYDPTIVMQDMGVVAMVQRDISYELEMIAGKVDIGLGQQALVAAGSMETQGADEGMQGSAETGGDDSAGVQGSGVTDGDDPAGTLEGSDFAGSTGGRDSEKDSLEGLQEESAQAKSRIYNSLEIDLEKLVQLSAGDSEKEWLAQYISRLEPTKTNAYTGMFEGYNLIYLTAEGFSTYAVSADLTPTLYKLVNSGFVFTNYYVPLWQTSTSDGEYVNLTGLIPDGQFSMSKTQNNNMAYVLPAFFDQEGCMNMAYHNNTLSYYDRHLSHPNLGYDFKASKLGDLDEAEWGDKIFYMENPGRWPASDLEMVQYTLPEYIQADRFNVYYMTVSGHMYYNFTGNSMSSKNREAVADLDMSENARAYIACQIELDKALEHLITELEAAGKLDNTVIVLSADHYPYAMTEEQYEELAGKDLSGDRDLYRNSLILWNSGMEENVIVTKPCCSVDILPTLLNLFGFSFDSRMYAGRDILSDAEGLVIFNDRSFVTDTVVYDRKNKTTAWRKELSEEEKESYLDRMKQEVKDRYAFSAYILRQDYYDIVKQCETAGQEN